MTVINIVSQINPEIWHSQKTFFDHTENCDFVFTRRPINADLHIYYGITEPDSTNMGKSKTILILSEPPEILKYKKKYLSEFSAIYGPDFCNPSFLSRKLSGPPLLPLHLGVNFTGNHSTLNSNLQTLSTQTLTKTKMLTAITSNKKSTPMQRRRISFLHHLKDEMGDDLQVFGRGVSEISDKWEVLAQSTHHIALENSKHLDYWSEKLSDSIFSRNFTYYSGAPNIYEYFSPKSILSIDLDNPKLTASIIAKHFYSTEIDLDGIEVNFQILKQNYHIFRFAESMIKSKNYADLPLMALKVSHHPTINFKNISANKIRILFEVFSRFIKKCMKLFN